MRSNIIQSLKRTGVLTRATTWTNLKYIMLSERSQSRKAIYCIILSIRNIQNRQIQIETESGFQGLGRGEWGVNTNGYEVSFRGDENFGELDGGDGCTTL